MKETIETRVQSKMWDIDDEYLIVEVQVSNFRRGDKVRVVIETIEQQ